MPYTELPLSVWLSCTICSGGLWKLNCPWGINKVFCICQGPAASRQGAQVKRLPEHPSGEITDTTVVKKKKKKPTGFSTPDIDFFWSLLSLGGVHADLYMSWLLFLSVYTTSFPTWQRGLWVFRWLLCQHKPGCNLQLIASPLTF